MRVNGLGFPFDVRDSSLSPLDSHWAHYNYFSILGLLCLFNARLFSRFHPSGLFGLGGKHEGTEQRS